MRNGTVWRCRWDGHQAREVDALLSAGPIVRCGPAGAFWRVARQERPYAQGNPVVVVLEPVCAHNISPMLKVPELPTPADAQAVSA
jgi:hypothetical protein